MKIKISNLKEKVFNYFKGNSSTKRKEKLSIKTKKLNKLKRISLTLIVTIFCTSVCPRLALAIETSPSGNPSCTHENAYYTFNQGIPCNNIEGTAKDTIFRICPDCGLCDEFQEAERTDIHKQKTVEYDGITYCYYCGEDINNPGSSIYEENPEMGIILARKYMLDNNLSLYQNGQLVTGNIDDPIDLSSDCNHRIGTDYVVNGDRLWKEETCFDCPYGMVTVIPDALFDTLEERIEMAKESQVVRDYFDARGLDYTGNVETKPQPQPQQQEQTKPQYDNNSNQKETVQGERIVPSSKVDFEEIVKYKNQKYIVKLYNNNILTISQTKKNDNFTLYIDLKTHRMQISIIGKETGLYDIKLEPNNKVLVTDLQTGEQKGLKLGNEGELQVASAMALGYGAVKAAQFLVPALIVVSIMFAATTAALIVDLIDYITPAINKFARTIDKYKAELIYVPLTAAAEKVAEAVERLTKGKSKDKKIYFAENLNRYGLNASTVNIGLPLTFTMARAYIKLFNGNVMTLYQSWAKDLNEVVGIKGYEVGSDRHLPCIPHIGSLKSKVKDLIRDNKDIYDSLLELFEKEYGRELTPQEKELEFTQLFDVDYKDCKSRGYFPHYHPIGYHFDDPTKPDPHIHFIIIGK